MDEILKAVAVAFVIGVVFGALKAPAPVPGTFAGALAILALFFGVQIGGRYL